MSTSTRPGNSRVAGGTITAFSSHSGVAEIGYGVTTPTMLPGIDAADHSRLRRDRSTGGTADAATSSALSGAGPNRCAGAGACPPPFRKPRIQLQIILCHVLRRESLVELGADAIAVEHADLAHRLHGLTFILYDESSDAVLENLRHR